MTSMRSLLLLAALAAPLRAEGEFVDAIAKKALDDAKQLAASLPSAADLGADWKRPWELPAGLPQAAPSESGYWERAAGAMGFAGFSEEQARTYADLFVAQLTPHGLTRRDALVFLLSRARGNNEPSAWKLAEGLETAKRALDAAPAPGAPRPDEKQALRTLLDATGAPYAKLNDQELLDAVVAQVSFAKSRTAMSYLLSNDWAGLAQVRSDRELKERKIWIAVAAVNLTMIERGRGALVRDVLAADREALEKRITAALGSLMEAGARTRRPELERELTRAREGLDAATSSLAAESDPERRRMFSERRDQRQKEVDTLQNELTGLAEMAKRVSCKITLLQFGENSYLVRILGAAPEQLNLNMAFFTGWIRKGDALIEVGLGGTMPEADLEQTMRKFLSELDAGMGAQDTSLASKVIPPQDDATPPVPPTHPPPPAIAENATFLATAPEPPPGPLAAALEDVDPEDPDSLRRQAAALLWTGHLKAALEVAREALALRPEDLTLRRERVLLELVAGHMIDGRAEAAALLKLHPDSTPLRILYAQACLALSDDRAAAPEFARAARDDPKAAQALHDQAFRLLEARAFALADLQFESALVMNPELHSAHYGLGVASQGQGMRMRSAAEFEAYLEREPNGPYATQAREALASAKAR
ncbi:MAG: hypothetical protein ACT4PV_15950 [Planctomycetaceae bacterium]